MKPEDYRYAFMVRSEVPYQVAPGVPQGVQAAEGVLQIGRVIYLKDWIGTRAEKTFAPAYVEGIGLVSVDSEMLQPV